MPCSVERRAGGQAAAGGAPGDGEPGQADGGGQAKEGFGVLAETLLAGAAALGVLLFVFGSALAVVPLAMAVVAIPACFAALYGLTEITGVSVIVQYLAALIGLGMAIDYSLLLVTRWRRNWPPATGARTR